MSETVPVNELLDHRQTLLYQGKAKALYSTKDPDVLLLDFKDDTSAFDGEKLEQLANKGWVNNHFNAFIMQQLSAEGIDNHLIKRCSNQQSLVKKLTMVPLESVVRNIAAGSLCKRLGIEPGRQFKPPVYEVFLKNDALHDPMVNESHCRTFAWAEAQTLQQMESISLAVNTVLTKLFAEHRMILVDFKLEFGFFKGKLVLGDEITPDVCRIWDASSHQKMDKDRFRQGLGRVVESYQEIGKRLGIKF